MKTTPCAFAALLLTFPVGAQLLTDTLLADIHTGAAIPDGSFSGAFASDGDTVWFRGVDAASGEGFRVWATDGSTAGTEQLTTLALDVHEAVFADDGDLYMLADELGFGVALWSSDGTAAGTQQVHAPEDWTVEPYDLTAFDGKLWFLAGTAATGVEVWSSDPVSGATALAFEFLPGPASGGGDLFASDDNLFLASGSVLLAGDGTAASLTNVATFSFPGPGSFDHVAAFGDTAVFNIGGFNESAGWWASDGTAAGTLRVSESFNDFWAVAADGKVYFTAGEASVPRLWETDGSLAGTLPVDDATSSGGQRVSFLHAGRADGDALWFGGFVAGAGFEPCHTTGAAAGSTLLADARPGGGSSDPSDFVLFGGDVFFRADDGTHGREIWTHDPAGGTTELLVDLTPGPTASFTGTTETLTSGAHGVVFGSHFPGAGLEPGVTDGVTTGLLLNLAPDGLTAGSGPTGFARLGNQVLFAATDELHGTELWTSDGSAAGTQLVLDIDPSAPGISSFGSQPRHLVRFADKVVFFAGEPATGRELWISDGTTAGTQLLADLVPGPVSSEPLFSAPPVVLGNRLFVIAREVGGGLALYASNGTTAGTGKVMTTDPAGFLAEFVQLEVVGERLVFNANLVGGLQLWTSDGTFAGSEPLTDLPSSTFFNIGVNVADDVAYFTTVDGSDHTLWKTDGTPAGTTAAFTSSGGFLGGPVIRGTFGDRVIFTAEAPGLGVEPWISDGTPAGTFVLGDVQPGPADSRALEFTASGDTVYFAVESPVGSSHFQQVWSTDGSADSAALVVELPSPVAGAGVGDFWAPGDNGELVFSNVDANGEEWWITDGTAAGTQALTDMAPGAAFARPRPGILVADTLLFSADDGDNGVELHALPFESTQSYAVTSLGHGCAGALGAPALTLGGGAPDVGQPFVLHVDDTQPGATVFWLLGFGFGSHAPLGVCAFELAAPTILISTPADGTGHAELPLSVPGNPALEGLVVDFQSFASEPGGPFLNLGSLTNVLEIVIGG